MDGFIRLVTEWLVLVAGRELAVFAWLLITLTIIGVVVGPWTFLRTRSRSKTEKREGQDR